MKRNGDTADLDEYDRGRMDMDELFNEILERAKRETVTREEFINFVEREMELSKKELEAIQHEQV